MKQDNGYKINSAIPTVFKANQEINWEETAGIVEFLRNINIDSISILLFGREYYRLSLEEKKKQIELVTGVAARNLKVFVGLSDVSLDSTIKLRREAARYGAAAGIISMPSSILIKHFLSRVFENSEIPLIFQDTGMDENILPEI
jgi:dihydrodipicolinate synthase/N-acetylneuraminate lyase